ncbi:TIGR02221 family CRISPR-associated protein [Methanocaldococcus indicus]|uniref:TIGR02221 family CRISPR-associated protein n=1 Tax=Methanocaldococcus indicus TaxID=213231 RepID=UPI003C6CFF91
MILLTFLGTGNYQETTYKIDDKEYRTPFIQEVLVKHFKIDEVIVYATPEVKEHKNLNELKNLLNNLNVRINVVDIPNVEEEKDLWTLFKNIYESVPKEKEIILDITHSLRYLPFLGFLILLFLKETKNIKISGVYYGAYEVSRKLGYSPIIEVTKAIELSNWIFATKSLKEYGKADEFKNLINNKSFVNTLINLSNSIYYNHNLWTLEKANELNNKKKLIEEISSNLPPVEYLKEDIFSFTDFGYKIRRRNNISELNKDILIKLFKVAEYQYSIELIPQFYQSIREWIIDYILYLANLTDNWLDYENSRMIAENAIYKLIDENKKIDNNIKEEVTQIEKIILEKGIKEDLVRAWNLIQNTRNTLSHAGRRKNLENLNNYKENAKEIINICKKLLEKI